MTFILISNILSQLDGLQHLSIAMLERHHRTGHKIYSSLSSHPRASSFRLKSFSINTRLDKDMLLFLQSEPCTTITSFKNETYLYDFYPLTIPTDTLPLLNAIQLFNPDFERLIPGRTVEAVGAVIVSYPYGQKLISWIHASAQPIVALYLRLWIPSFSAQFMHALGQSLPTLSLLKLDLNFPDLSTTTLFLSTLSSFPALTHLELIL